MHRTTVAAFCLAPALALAVGACGSEAATEPDAGYNRAVETRDDEFALGLEKTGPDGMVFRLDDAEPGLPIRGDNVWTFAIDADDGSPLDGAAVDVTPFMPDHQHGTPIAVEITPQGEAGKYVAQPVNLWMPGLWEITIKATPAGGVTADAQQTVFRFCLAD